MKNENWDVQFLRDGVWRWVGVEPQGMLWSVARRVALRFANGGARELRADAFRVRMVTEPESGGAPEHTICVSQQRRTPYPAPGLDHTVCVSGAAPEHTGPEGNEPGAPHDILKQCERMQRDVSGTPITLAELRAMLRDVVDDGGLIVHRISVPCLRAIVRDSDEQLAAANARVAELTEQRDLGRGHAGRMMAERDAANARVAELERDKAALLDSNRGLAGMVDAANDRVAELEHQHDQDVDAIARACRHEDAANARADAAERSEKDAVAVAADSMARAEAAEQETRRTAKQSAENFKARERAESERDEWKAKCEAAERSKRDAWESARAEQTARQRAESEAAALRAEVARVTAEAGALSAEVVRLRNGWDTADVVSRSRYLEIQELMSRLSTATGLLGEARRALDDMLERYQAEGWTSIKAQAVANRLRAFLATAPAPTEHAECVSGYVGASGECNDCGKLDCHMADHERVAAERAVLEAMAGLTPKNLEDLQDNYVMTDVVDAELARRAVKTDVSS